MFSSEKSQKKTGSNSKKKESKHVTRATEDRPKSQSKGKKIVGFFKLLTRIGGITSWVAEQDGDVPLMQRNYLNI